VYLTWADSQFLAFIAFNGINNLRAFNVAFSSIPTAPTIKPPDQTKSRAQFGTMWAGWISALKPAGDRGGCLDLCVGYQWEYKAEKARRDGDAGA
jgi:hypothetical protein